jgi:hypothetical protein
MPCPGKPRGGKAAEFREKATELRARASAEADPAIIKAYIVLAEALELRARRIEMPENRRTPRLRRKPRPMH